jgi:alpha-beta hydrolase superfamily lysophospholipase
MRVGIDGQVVLVDARPFWQRRHRRRGVVAFIYDKRGVGESTGDWKTSTLDDLARDAKAAIHVLAVSGRR